MTISGGRKSRRSVRATAVLVVAMALVAGCTSVPGVPQAAAPGDSSFPPVQASAAADVVGENAESASGPTSGQLIAEASQAGQIDEPTSLLYRLWATFGDRALPAEYQGAPEPHDLGLFVELQDSLDGLPGEIRSQVEPYLKRPSDPESIFSTDTPTHDGPPGFRAPIQPPPLTEAQSPERASSLDTCEPSPKGEAQSKWRSKPVAGLRFCVWVPSTDVDSNKSNDYYIDLVAGMLINHVGQMEADMGTTLPDYQVDDRIDVYFLPDGWFGPYRNHDSKNIAADAGGVTIPVPHLGTDPPKSAGSGYILLPSILLDDNDHVSLEGSLVHEVFHVLQFAHHAHLESGWFYEASATWAEVHYVPEWAPRIHSISLPFLQSSQLSLHSETPPDHPYWAYVWPLFMEQESGAQTIFGTWKALEEAGSGTAEEVLAIINSQLRFAPSFHEFAMRLLNLDLPGDPIQPRFGDFDPTFPGTTTPHLAPKVLGSAPLSLDHSNMTGLSYRYSSVKVPVPDGKAALVTISGDLTRADGSHVFPTVEALVRDRDGKVSRQPIDISGDGTNVCVAGALHLVVTNPDIDADTELKGSEMVVKRVKQDGEDVDCKCSFNLDYVVIAPELSDIEKHNLQVKMFSLSEWIPKSVWGNGGKHKGYRPVGPVYGHDDGFGASPIGLISTNPDGAGAPQTFVVHQDSPPSSQSWGPPKDSMPYRIDIEFASDLRTEGSMPFTVAANVDLTVWDTYTAPSIGSPSDAEYNYPGEIVGSAVYHHSASTTAEITSIDYHTGPDGEQRIIGLTFTISSSAAAEDGGGSLDGDFRYDNVGCAPGN